MNRQDAENAKVFLADLGVPGVVAVQSLFLASFNPIALRTRCRN
jgi:hypothetical protein